MRENGAMWVSLPTMNIYKKDTREGAFLYMFNVYFDFTEVGF